MTRTLDAVWYVHVYVLVWPSCESALYVARLEGPVELAVWPSAALVPSCALVRIRRRPWCSGSMPDCKEPALAWRRFGHPADPVRFWVGGLSFAAHTTRVPNVYRRILIVVQDRASQLCCLEVSQPYSCSGHPACRTRFAARPAKQRPPQSTQDAIDTSAQVPRVRFPSVALEAPRRSLVDRETARVVQWFSTPRCQRGNPSSILGAGAAT